MLSVADKELVELLRKGSVVWNAWRHKDLHSEQDLVVADLSGANLSDLDLSRANLRSVDLNGANLSHAKLIYSDLRYADLSYVDLSYVDLSGAALSNADLGNAKLRNADLANADLSNAKLKSANLTLANLRGVNLLSANLGLANLMNADLSHAELGGANLSGANLTSADLSFALLSDADLSRATLDFAKLSKAYLEGTRLTKASLHETVFADSDLSRVTGLETCVHRGPSVVDFRTLADSGPLPLVFLRGVGLPDNLIDYLPSLVGQAIQYYSCFISYSSRDDDFARRIHADLQGKGVRCWFAPHDLPIGGKIMDEIDAAVRLRDKLLLVLSEHAIESDWVEDEVKTAFEEERRRGQTVLFPIRLDDAVLGTKEAWAGKLRMDRNIGDFRQWKDHDRYQESLKRVLRDLSARP